MGQMIQALDERVSMWGKIKVRTVLVVMLAIPGNKILAEERNVELVFRVEKRGAAIVEQLYREPVVDNVLIYSRNRGLKSGCN